MKAPPKLVCLEGYWNEQMFQNFSVKPFFEAMAPLVHPPLTLAHRFVESGAALAYYARRPDGLLWRRQELFDAPIYYLAFHGRPGSASLVCDPLFLHRFYRDPSPWKNLRRIFSFGAPRLPAGAAPGPYPAHPRLTGAARYFRLHIFRLGVPSWTENSSPGTTTTARCASGSGCSPAPS